MKSLTIYLNDEDFEKVKQIVKERQTSASQWYRELTQLGFSLYKPETIEPQKTFSGIGKDF